MRNFQGLHWFNQPFRFRLAGMISLSLWAVPLALGSLASYQPPNGGSSPGTPSGSTGTRSGCIANEAVPLTVLAPNAHVGQTISAYPTFFWYAPDVSTPTVEFSLYQVDQANQVTVIQQETLNRTAGLMSYTLPNSEPGLVQGQRYLWQVLFLCNPDRPSSAVSVEAYVERVPATVQTMNAEQLAEAGLWYDALAVALSNSSSPYWLELLDSLAQFEPASNDSRLLSQRDRLQRVIEHER